MNILILIISIAIVFLLICIIQATSGSVYSKKYRYSKLAVGMILVGACVSGILFIMQLTLDDALLQKYLGVSNPSVGLLITGFVFFAVFTHSAIYYASLRFSAKDGRLESHSVYGSRVIYLSRPYEHLYNKSSGNPSAAMHVFKQGRTRIKLTRLIVGLEGLLEEVSRESKDGVVQYRTIN